MDTHADCDATKTCPTTDCCGTATPEQGTQTKQICYTRTATEWQDANQGFAKYAFACLSAEGATALQMGVLSAMSAAAVIATL